MKLPDGWVFEVEMDSKCTEIRVKDRELVKCRSCKHRPVYDDSGKKSGFNLVFPDYKCPCQCDDGYYSRMPDDDWWCAEGEAKE